MNTTVNSFQFGRLQVEQAEADPAPAPLTSRPMPGISTSTSRANAISSRAGAVRCQNDNGISRVTTGARADGQINQVADHVVQRIAGQRRATSELKPR